MNNCRYFVIQNRDGVDCLRVEQDDPIARITCVTTIPLYGIETAIDQYKKDLYRHTLRRVRISTAPGGMPVGHAVKVCDADTGEEIPHVARVAITLNPEMINLAELTFFDFKLTSAGDVKTTREFVKNPEVDLNAFAIPFDREVSDAS